MASLSGPLRLQFRAPPVSGRRPAIFLDRDGVVNERIIGGYVTRWDEFQFLDGILPVLRAFTWLHVPVIVISNQSGVNKGLVTPRSLRQITTRFVESLARQRVRMDAAYYCPHTDEQGCSCRKPKPGLLLRAAREYGIDLSRSVMVGDSESDVDAAAAANCQGLLLDHGSEKVPVRDDENAIALNTAAVVTVRRLPDLPAQVAAMLGRPLL